ncbi:MAG: tetratricopeptide repeat protein [Acidimicrobiia bacterium]
MGPDGHDGTEALIDALLAFKPEVVDHATVLSTEHPDLAVGHALVAYLHLMSSEQRDVEVAVAAHQAMSTCDLGEREQAHRRAIGEWIQGRWHGAADALDDLLVRWPTDLLALQLGHQLDFFTGDAQNLRDRVGRSLSAIAGHPHHGFVLGMQSFGLEEYGHYEAAEEAGMAALDAHRDDVWAIHAVTHAHEMRGRVAEGVDLLEGRVADWGSGNLFTVHNWWHLALFKLELGDLASVLDIYDREVHHPGSDGVALELLDASALLWRLHLDGTDVGDRWAPLADAWAAAETPPWYAFNDLHAVMAYVGAGRMDDARRVVDRLEAYVAQGEGASNLAMTADVGLPTSRAVVAFAEGRWDDVVAELAPRRRWFNRFGGSHAQRDVLQRTLLEAAIRGDQHDLARALVSERLAVRPSSAYARTQSTRLP